MPASSFPVPLTTVDVLHSLRVRSTTPSESGKYQFTSNEHGYHVLMEVRFDEGDNTIKDTKYMTLYQSVSAMTRRQNSPFGRVLAEFTFIYGCDGAFKWFDME